MAHFEELYPSRFLKGVTISAPKTIRVVGIYNETLECKDDDDDDTERAKPKLKTILKYKDAKGVGEIVWCKTNAHLAAAALGEEDYSKWPGHLLTIHHDKSVRFGKKKPGGIRVLGSPEMTAVKTVEIVRPRRKTPDIYKLVPTKGPGSARPAAIDPKYAEQIAAIRETTDHEQLDEVLANIADLRSDEGLLPDQLQAIVDDQRAKLSKSQ